MRRKSPSGKRKMRPRPRAGRLSCEDSTVGCSMAHRGRAHRTPKGCSYLMIATLQGDSTRAHCQSLASRPAFGTFVREATTTSAKRRSYTSNTCVQLRNGVYPFRATHAMNTIQEAEVQHNDVRPTSTESRQRLVDALRRLHGSKERCSFID